MERKSRTQTNLMKEAAIATGLAAAMFLGTEKLHARDVYVPVEYPTIQEAIDASVDNDRVIVSSGIYSGEGNNNISFLGKSIIVKSEAGPKYCIIDCLGTNGFLFNNGEEPNSTLDGFTIKKGHSFGSQISQVGGGILCDDTSPTIANCIITESDWGIDGRYGNPIIVNCEIRNNTQTGIRLYLSSNPIILNSTIINNIGDGIFIYNCGRGYCIDANTIISNSIIRGNTENQIRVADPDTGNPTVNNSNIQGDWVGDGNIDNDAGFAFANAPYLMPGSICIDAGNNASIEAFLYNDIDGTARIIDGDIDGSPIVDMGAYEHNPDNPTIALSESYFFYKQSSQTPDSKIVSIRNAGGGILNWEVVEDCNWINVSPIRGSSNGSIQDIVLEVDASGKQVGYYDYEIDVVDPIAVNNPRKILIDLHVAEPVVYVPVTVSTIQEAVEHVLDHGEVVVANGVYTGAGNKNIGFLGKPITIRSENGPDNCIIDCQNSGRGFYFHQGEDADSVLDGFTIQNGNVDGHGGGISCDHSQWPTIKNCKLINNYAKLHGGGIYVYLSNPRVSNCYFYGNRSAADGGGVWVRGSSPIFSESTFQSNSTNGAGGAMLFYSSYPQINNCLFMRNDASYGGFGGGTIFTQLGGPTFNNCTFANNSIRKAGAIYVYDGNVTLNNCIMWNMDNSGYEIYLYPKYYQIVRVNTSDFKNGRDGISPSSWASIYWGSGNIDEDPLLADPNNNDYHLKSRAGRYDSNTKSWTLDDVTSPCIDAGNQASPIMYEPFPNGGVINMGAYGGTKEASKTYFGSPLCETIVAGDINGDCEVNFLDFRLIALHWMEVHE